MYLAPELRRQYLIDPKYSKDGNLIANYDPLKTDAYSLGCVILQVVLGLD